MNALISNSQVVITRSMQLSAQVLYNDPRGLCYYRTEIRNHNTRFELSQIKKPLVRQQLNFDLTVSSQIW